MNAATDCQVLRIYLSKLLESLTECELCSDLLALEGTMHEVNLLLVSSLVLVETLDHTLSFFDLPVSHLIIGCLWHDD